MGLLAEVQQKGLAPNAITYSSAISARDAKQLCNAWCSLLRGGRKVNMMVITGVLVLRPSMNRFRSFLNALAE